MFKREVYECLCMCIHTHTQYINTIFSHLTTNWFSLHRIPALQNGKCSRNKTSGKSNSYAVWSYSMQYLPFSSDKLYQMRNFIFPPFFLVLITTVAQKAKQTREGHVIPTLPLRREDVQRLPSSACTLTYIGWMTSKENCKSIGNYKAGNLPGITEK